MLNVLVFLGIVRNYKPKRQQATDHESLREAVKLVQEQGYSIRKAAAEKNVAFESLRRWVKEFMVAKNKIFENKLLFLN